ncbi:MAG: hypothetical protein JSS46_10720 [Proteobacteria bacterium]|jgi:hypothetical protein|nr:hypothetical protein [Pseudomonadota bacterium]
MPEGDNERPAAAWDEAIVAHSERVRAHDRSRASWIGNGLPLALAVASLVLLLALQAIGLVRDRMALAGVRAAQDAPLAQAAKVRQQLETLGGETARLAQEGDAAARAIVSSMARQGVTLKPPGAQTAPAK